MQLPLPLLHAQGGVRPATTSSSPEDLLLSFEEIERVARVSTRLGVRKIRLTGGEPLLRKRRRRPWWRARGHPRHRRPDHDHQRIGAGPQGAGSRRCRSRPGHGEPRLARRRHLHGHERRRLPRGQGARGHRCRHRRRVDPPQDQHGRQARRQRRARWWPSPATSRARGTSSGSSSTWTWATPTGGVSTTSCLRPRWSRRSTPSSPWSRSLPTTPARSPTGGGTRMAKARSGSSPRSPAPSAVPAPGRRLSAEGMLYTCLFATGGHDLRGAAPRTVPPMTKWPSSSRRCGRPATIATRRLRSSRTADLPKIEMSYIGG